MKFEICPTCSAQMVLSADDKNMWCDRCNIFVKLPYCDPIIGIAKGIRRSLYSDMDCPHCFGSGRKAGTGRAVGTVIDCSCFSNRMVAEARKQYVADMNQKDYRKEYENEFPKGGYDDEMFQNEFLNLYSLNCCVNIVSDEERSICPYETCLGG